MLLIFKNVSSLFSSYAFWATKLSMKKYLGRRRSTITKTLTFNRSTSKEGFQVYPSVQITKMPISYHENKREKERFTLPIKR